ncbi:MAG: hypothetical protein PVJ04_12425 [Gemmatimonadota bacterium]|jgi:hypothetical protein
MADRVRKVKYCYVTVPSRAGQGARVLDELRDAGVNLIAFSGFPGKKRASQLDLVTEDMPAVRRVARQNGWRLSKIKKGFHIQGSDKAGAVARHVDKLAEAKINVVAADAIAAGKGRFGMVLWVRPKDYTRAARILRAK